MGNEIVICILLSGRDRSVKYLFDPILPSVDGYLTVRGFDYDQANEPVPRDRYELIALDHIDVITVQPDDLASLRLSLGRRYVVKVSDTL